MRLRRTPLSCQELVELVTAYVEDQLPRRDRRRFDAHIAQCDGCGRYLAQMRETIRLTGRLEAERLSEPTRDALLHAFRDWNRTRSA